MSHNVESMMYAGEIPWHGLGTALPGNVSWEDALKVAGLDWEVGLKPVYSRVGQKFQAIKGSAAITRMTDDTVYAIASSDFYKPIQNREAFAIFGDLFGDAAVLHTAGSLQSGAIVWGLAELPERQIVGETHRQFLLVTTRHDKKGCLRAFPTDTRVVCNNTLNLALRGADSGVRVGHFGDVEAKREVASATLAEVLGYFETFAANAEKLAKAAIAEEQEREILVEMFPGDHAIPTKTRERCLYLAHYGLGNEPFAGTLYGLLNGITQYVDHDKMEKAEVGRRFQYQTMSAGASLKAKALDLVTKLAA